MVSPFCFGFWWWRWSFCFFEKEEETMRHREREKEREQEREQTAESFSSPSLSLSLSLLSPFPTTLLTVAQRQVLRQLAQHERQGDQRREVEREDRHSTPAEERRCPTQRDADE